MGDSNTKIAVIRVLNRHSPISAKRIHSLINKEYGVKISYQAAHKAIRNMEETGILENDEKGYSINPEWVQNIGDLVEKLESSPDAIKGIFSKLDSGKVVNFTAPSEAQMGYFVVDMINGILEKGGKGPFTFNLFFVWTIFPLNDKQFKILERIMKQDVYVVSQEGLFWDKAMAKHWQDAGARVIIGKEDCVSTSDVITFGDYIINIYWPEEHLQEVFEDNRRMKSREDFNYKQVQEIINRPVNIEFTIIKNKEVAERLRQKTMRYFNEV
ncbi:hypothetical protein GF345_04295 [Candidatus Woesearchaeota archaeon]|nr:hypothetical protein [Candidatus Woesearchaeota archaeon]